METKCEKCCNFCLGDVCCSRDWKIISMQQQASRGGFCYGIIDVFKVKKIICFGIVLQDVRS